jgi:uncharacterized protein (TIGR02145 family)
MKAIVICLLLLPAFLVKGQIMPVGFFRAKVATKFTVKDTCGNVYDTVHIGTQVWLKQNLKTTKYSNGDAITNVTNNATWAALKAPAYCDYNNEPDSSVIYGRLYNYYTVADTNTHKLCPTGWHVPADAEWTTLTTYLEGESVAGSKLKEAGLAHWTTPNTDATNETGFTALPGGIRYDNGAFNYVGRYGSWWSSSENNTTSAWYRYMYYNNSNVYRYSNNKELGFSARCLRD